MSTPRAVDSALVSTGPGLDPPPVPPGADPGERLVVLDVLRGVALCGIVWVNVPGITAFTSHAGPVHDVAPWLEPLVRGRFIAVFAFLFGVSFALVLRGAVHRARRPRVVLARRLVFLLGLGLLHGLLQPGEVLATYALIGLALLLPLSFARWPWVPLVLGVLALSAVWLLHLDPQQVALPMVLLGFGAARLGLPERLERPGRGAAVAAALLLPAYAVVLVLQRTVTSPVVDGASDAFTWADRLAAVVGAATVVVVVALALRTRARGVLRAVFEPLGRTALTNYVGATVLAVLARLVSGSPAAGSTAPDLLLCAGILVVQVPASRWWLARYRYGPLEWAWRCATWWRVVPRRASAPVVGHPRS